ncbi:MAG TPA: alpha/beta fold hydrolase [Telluria sp.]
MIAVTLHGAHATRDSWNAIRPHLGETIDLSYDVAEGFDAITTRLTSELAAVDGPIGLIAHSQGGNLALALADRLGDRVRGAVSMCSPFGGSAAAAILPFLAPLYHPQLMRDIHPRSLPISRGRAIKLRCPWTQIVATEDRIVSRISAESRSDMRIVRVATTHTEVLLNAEALDVIRAAVAQWGEQ